MNREVKFESSINDLVTQSYLLSSLRLILNYFYRQVVIGKSTMGI